VSQKTKKLKKPRKPEKEITKKPIKTIKILKKPTGLVRFWFYKPETKKTNRTEPKPKKTGKKPSQNRANRTKPKKPSQTGLNRFLS
jgi:hypothetical protein